MLCSIFFGSTYKVFSSPLSNNFNLMSSDSQNVFWPNSDKQPVLMSNNAALLGKISSTFSTKKFLNFLAVLSKDLLNQHLSWQFFPSISLISVSFAGVAFMKRNFGSEFLKHLPFGLDTLNAIS